MAIDIACTLILTFKLPHLNRSFVRLLSIRIKRLINFDDDSVCDLREIVALFVRQHLQFDSSSDEKYIRFSSTKSLFFT